MLFFKKNTANGSYTVTVDITSFFFNSAVYLLLPGELLFFICFNILRTSPSSMSFSRLLDVFVSILGVVKFEKSSFKFILTKIVSALLYRVS